MGTKADGIRAMIEESPPRVKDEVMKHYDRLNAYVAEHGTRAIVAILLIGTEIAEADEDCLQAH